MKEIFQFIALSMLCIGCTEKRGFFNATEKTFGDFEQEISLKAEPVVFDSMPLSLLGVDYVDGLLLFKHSEMPYLFSIVNIETKKFISNFLRRGRGPDEFTYLSYWGESEVQNGDRWLYMSDINTNKIIKVNLTDFVESGLTNIELLDKYNGTQLQNHILNDSTFLVSMYYESEAGIRMFYRKYSNKGILDIQDIDFVTVNDYDELDLFGMSEYLRPDKKKMAMSMMDMNRINIFDLENSKRNITLTPKGSVFVPPSELVQQDYTETMMYYHGMRTTQDYIFTLYVDQLLEEWQEESKPIEIHVFDWEGNPRYKLHIDEYLQDFCIDTDNNVMYAFDYSDNIYLYDLSRILK